MDEERLAEVPHYHSMNSASKPQGTSTPHRSLMQNPRYDPGMLYDGEYLIGESSNQPRNSAHRNLNDRWTPRHDVSGNQQHRAIPSLMSRLLRCIDDRGVLDSFGAGENVWLAYQANFESVDTVLDAFIKENCHKITDTRSPKLYQFNDENFQSKMVFASFVNSKVAVQMSCSAKKSVDEQTHQAAMGKIGGGWSNLTKDYHYPDFHPFSGQPIESTYFKRAADEPAHVLLKRLLISVLSKSCSKQSDVQGPWSLDGGDLAKKKLFPLEFYNTLRDLCAEFFSLNHTVLDSPWKETLRSLPFLSHYSEEVRMERFMVLQDSKKKFYNYSFHHYFKEALKELQHGSFLPLQPGETHQRFVLRQRYNRKEPSASGNSVAHSPKTPAPTTPNDVIIRQPTVINAPKPLIARVNVAAQIKTVEHYGKAGKEKTKEADGTAVSRTMNSDCNGGFSSAPNEQVMPNRPTMNSVESLDNPMTVESKKDPRPTTSKSTRTTTRKRPATRASKAD